MLIKHLKQGRTFFALVLLLPLVLSPVILVFWLIWQAPGKQSQESIGQNELAVKPSPEDWPMLMERMSAPAPLTPAEIEEQADLVNDQIATARQWLESRDAKTRMNGAEQLTAYPTEEAETVLTSVLLSEPEPEVRTAIIRALAYIKNPQQNTLNHLFGALENDTDTVQMQILHTLTTYVAHEPYGSKRANEIIAKLKHVDDLGILKGVAQAVLQNFLSDQSPHSPQN